MTETEREIVRRAVQRVREIALKVSPQVYVQVREATRPLLPLVGYRTHD